MWKDIALPVLLAAVVSVEGHGYVKSPPSRGYACNQRLNTGCGAVQYEPQSVEGPDRYPASGPPDGAIASAGSDRWVALDQQTASRWAKTSVSSGGITEFTWQFTANHVTLDWRYYITKDGWNPSAPLTRDTFEDSPFCAEAGGMVKPPMVTTHSCTLPPKSGYHVVLAIWDVGDTAASFYNAIDLDFSGGNGGGGNGGGNPTPPTPPTPATTPTPPTPAATPTPPTPPRTPMPQAPPVGPGQSNCQYKIAEWGGCLHAPTCCTNGASCYQQSNWYAQCLKANHNGYKIG